MDEGTTILVRGAENRECTGMHRPRAARCVTEHTFTAVSLYLNFRRTGRRPLASESAA